MTDLKPYLEDFVQANTPDEPPPPLATDSRSSKWRPAVRWVTAAAAVIVVAAVGAVWVTQRGDDAPLVIDSASSDHYPNATAEDWVTYADHVLVVTPVAERALEPGSDEDGEGGLIDRDVTLRVDRVLWSRPDPDQPAPKTLDWKGWGWQFDGDPDDRTPIVGAGTSRVVPGHSYLLAVAWEPARCSPGDPVEPAGWTGLGGASVVPFDRGTVGEGEFEGRVRTASEAKADADPSDPNFTFAQRMTGADGAQVAQALETARPGKPEQFVTPAPCPT